MTKSFSFHYVHKMYKKWSSHKSKYQIIICIINSFIQSEKNDLEGRSSKCHYNVRIRLVVCVPIITYQNHFYVFHVAIADIKNNFPFELHVLQQIYICVYFSTNSPSNTMIVIDLRFTLKYALYISKKFQGRDRSTTLQI